MKSYKKYLIISGFLIASICSIAHAAYNFDYAAYNSDDETVAAEHEYNSLSLISAVQDGSLQQVKILLDFLNSDEINTQDVEGFTALHYAAFFDKYKIVNELLKAGANVNNPNDDGDTPLHAALLNKSIESAKELLDAGADINRKNYAGVTPRDIVVADKSMQAALEVYLQL